MNHKIIALFGVLLALVSVTFFSCKTDETLASEDWNGRWQFSQDVVFPQTKNNENFPKSSNGTIKIDPNNNRKIIISGDLFGLYSTLSISADVVSTTATFDQTVGVYKMKGTATIVSEDRINFKFTITTESNYSESYERTATRI